MNCKRLQNTFRHINFSLVALERNMWSPAISPGRRREVGARTTRKPETWEQRNQISVDSSGEYMGGSEE